MENLHKVLEANKRVFDLLRRTKLEGLTENELKKIILCEYRSFLGSFTFNGDIVAGKNSAIGEGTGTDYVIRSGDSVILDLLPYKNKKCADTTRTFFVGEPSALQRDVYNTVKHALCEVEKILKPGIRACDIYREMRERLKPYEDTFFHHAGHLIKARRLCQPQFLPNKSARLRVGDVVTLEPGIYIKDEFGVRLENNYLITENGCKNLFEYPLDIENFISQKE